MDSHLDYVLDFLRDLARNNTRAWMHTRANAKRYEIVKRTWEKFISLMAIDLSDFEDTRGLKPKDMIYRIWRDTRFSKDKTPCKTYLSAIICKGGRKNPNRAVYYIHLQPGGKSFIGGGVHMPDSPQLKKIRKELTYTGGELAKILKEPKFKRMFGAMEEVRLKTMPRDYRKADVAPVVRELLPYTSFVVGHNLSDKEILAKDIETKIMKIFTVLRPFNDWFNTALQ